MIHVDVNTPEVVEIFASILDGEANVMGEIGMYAVATVIAERLKQGQSPWQIERDFNGRVHKPSELSKRLARQIGSGEVLGGGYMYCMSEKDRRDNGWQVGDMVVRANGFQIHLYRKFPMKEN